MNVTVEEAAKLMRKRPQYIRIGLQQGILPFGVAIKISDKRYNYHISKKLLKDYIGEWEEDGRAAVKGAV